MDNSLLNLSLVCIICLKDESNFSSIYHKDEHTPQLKIVDKIACCTRLNVNNYSTCKIQLPNKICNACLSELNDTWHFLSKCDAAVNVFESLKVATTTTTTVSTDEMEFDNVVSQDSFRLKLPLPLNIKRIQPSKKTKKFNVKLPAVTSPCREKTPNGSNRTHLKIEIDTRSAITLNDTIDVTSCLSLDDNDADNDNGSDIAFVSMINHDDQHIVEEEIQYQIFDGASRFFDENDDGDGVGDGNGDDDCDDDDDSDSEDNNEDEQLQYSFKHNPTKINIDKTLLPNKNDNVQENRRQTRSSNNACQTSKQQTITATSPKSKSFTRANQRPVINNMAVAVETSQKMLQHAMISSNASDSSNSQSNASNNNDNNNKTTTCGSTEKMHPSRSGGIRPPKICEVCGNTYKYQHALNAHMRRHNNERPFSCEVCNKAFISNVELRRHMRVHTGQKPYACKYCDRRFSDFGSSKKHERSHTGERPYVCDVCKKGFAYAHVLSVHKRTHTGQKQFQCTQCQKGFTKKVYLQAHLESHRHTQSLHFQKTSMDVNTSVVPSTHCGDDDGVGVGVDNGGVYLNSVDDNAALAGMQLMDDSETMSAVAVSFEEGRVLEECIVTSEFISDGVVDSNDFVHDTANGVADGDLDAINTHTQHLNAGVRSAYTVELNGDFLDEHNLVESKYMIQ